jgi:hypothetical protein
MGHLRRWTRAKRRRAREKADVSLRRRQQLIDRVRGRLDSSYAAYLPVTQYMQQRLDLRSQFQKGLGMTKGRNSTFQPEDEAMAVLGRLMLGITRREHLDKLLPEQMIAEALGIERWPSGDTERRFYIRFQEQGLAGLDRISESLVLTQALQEGTDPIHEDIDGTGLQSQAEKREGVASGYMGGPIKPGYQNLRIGVNGVTLWTDLRAGNDGYEDLFEIGVQKARLLRQKQPHRLVYYTGDSKFGKQYHIEGAQRMAQKDRKFVFFVGGSRQYCRHDWWDQVVSVEQGSWQRVSKTTEIRELGLQAPWGPKGPQVRVVATRKEDWKAKHAERKKGKRKRSSKPEPKYRYQVIYTCARRSWMTARDVFHEYHQGQRREFEIKDGKQSFEIRKLPVKELIGNRAYVKLAAIAQSIVANYQRKFLNVKPWGLQAKTMREVTFKIGGKKGAGRDNPAGTLL